MDVELDGHEAQFEPDGMRLLGSEKEERACHYERPEGAPTVSERVELGDSSGAIGIAGSG